MPNIDADNLYATLWGQLSGVLGTLCSHPAFAAHAERLWGDGQLCSGLLQVLLPGISAAAVGLQLPPERCLAGYTWQNAACVAGFVSACPAGALNEALHAKPETTRRLLAAATQLLQQCPSAAPAPADLAAADMLESTLPFIWQLGAAASAQPPAAEGAMLGQPRLARQVLGTLPRVGEALAAAAQGPGLGPSISARLVGSAAQVAVVLATTAGAARPAMPPGQDSPAWLCAAAAAVRWLPSLLAVNGQHLRHPEGAAALLHSTEAAAAALDLAMQVGRGCYAGVQLPGAASAACRASNWDEQLSALWELHTVACRLVHWLLAGSIPEAWLLSPAIQRPANLYTLVMNPFLAASFMGMARRASLPPTAQR